MMPPRMPPAPPMMPVQPNKDRTAAVVVGLLILFALVIGGVAAGAVFWMRARVGPAPPVSVTVAPGPLPPSPGDNPGPPVVATPVGSVQGSPEPTIGFFGDLEWQRPVEAADLHKVDLRDLFAQARPIAEKIQSGAQFVGIVAFDIQGGAADLVGESRVLIQFEFAGTDPTQPPGKDSVEYKVDVEAKKGVLLGRRMKWPATQLKHFGGVLTPPACSSAKMWATVTGSGVPDNAVATVHYYDNKVFSPKSPVVWSVRVDGHDEFRREVDGQTCAMVKNWGKK